MSVPKMPVPKILFALLLFVAAGMAAARGPEPPQRIPLTSLGWQPSTASVLATGASATTVHFIDEQHLLVTYNVRRLMKRLPGDPPTDTDRTVEAVVVELPSGKVLARTHWRTHDIGQYLWDLGQGRFLLRIRDTLTTFVPLANLATDPFAEQPFLNSSRKLVAVLISAERDLVTVETVDQPPPTLPGPNGAADAPPPAEPQRTQINFYRLLQPSLPGDRVILQSAGVALARGAINISLTSAGYIEILQERPNRWLFDFDNYAGTFKELAPFDTTCRPQVSFVSASEFVAFGCRGTPDKQSIGGFNMKGEQVWQQDFNDAHAFPNFAFAPAAGRFALSRDIVSSTAGITVDFAPSAFTTQEIRVYQSSTGRQLLRVEATPVQRTGQNYDLSPDGLRLAVLRNDAAEIYRLPALTREEEAALREARALAPEDAKVAVNLASHIKPDPATKVSDAAFKPALATPEPPLADAPPKATEPRKPPTLYTLPTDNPEKPAKPPLP